MKLSIFTTVTNPLERGDTYHQALECYKDLADEVVVVDGGQMEQEPNVKYVNHPWSKEFEWSFFGEQFQRGYDACTGDWVIRADLDYIFHEKDFAKIRQAMEDNPEATGLAFYKYQFILPDRYSVKSRLVVALNKRKYGSGIKFDGGGDICQATVHGNWIDPNNVPNTGVGIYNYEKMLKTKDQIGTDVGRMERAWKRHYGRTQYRTDGTDENALEKWLEAQKGKLAKEQKHISLSEHPKYIQETIKNLKPDNFGYNGFGLIEGGVYV